MTREQILLDLQQEYRHRQEANLRKYEARVDEVSAKLPRLGQLMAKRHALVMGTIRQGLLNPGRDQNAQQNLPSLMADMNRQIKEQLISGGYPEDYLQPIYTCPVCKDEGYVFDPSRRMCDCLNRELNRRLLEEAGLAGDTQTFENYDPEVFSDKDEVGGTTQRQMAEFIRKTCQNFADSFPATQWQNLLLMGQSGLGKTYMLRCIAHRTAERGFQPMYTSAYHLLELARKGYMENSSAPLAPLMEAPLLLIDDLGTEPLMQNITVTQLFNLLNERQLRGLHTVISTNLSMSELKERYTERISSRLMDASCWRRLSFIGGDVRTRLKRS